MSFMKGLKNFDLYPKTLEDFRVRTFSGALVSVVSGILIILLILSELVAFMSITVDNELTVDAGRGGKLQINVDLVFPSLPCNFLSVDALDISGDSQLDVDTSIYKRRLKADGTPLSEGEAEQVRIKAHLSDPEKVNIPKNVNGCESCYGAESDTFRCCPTCEEVREAYRHKGWAFNSPQAIAQCKNEGFQDHMKAQKDEGCQLYGTLQVQKVAGNFHIAPGKSYESHHMHVHDLQTVNFGVFNMSHHIKKLSFGTDFPGVVQPMDGVRKLTLDTSSLYQYYIKVVPTTYEHADGTVIDSNQFSVTEYYKPLSGSAATASDSHGLPGVYFIYDLSPIRVNYIERQRSFSQFLTGVCAIIGGIFTISSLIDSFIYHGIQSMKHKNEIGKAH